MDCMYANRFFIANSSTDTYITFTFAAPELDEKGEIAGDRIIDRREIVLTHEAAQSLEDMLHSVLNGDSKTGE